ncbi:uncharacterized protein K444DRAFT_625216 [Hyaloscypha bicolor E]|uniref:F-box domain-containing protein n=1 Tax=Hyaloscypha bicolor E TaxID=1095630 RepID=A0A2J6TRL4_9HELO|nr:uncharacterized protein K444DRAFT_625216 [Hyaloscypha bicolor E]PMD65666.1 hypothetical protein K444DRAFT_625216 [Hyaloscypha bicolor E]
MVFHHDIVYFIQALLIFCCFVDAASYDMTGQWDITYGDTAPQLSHIKDSRDDGISFEANQARMSIYSKHIYQGKKLGDFSLPGTQHLKLEYWDEPPHRTSDHEFFLQHLETLEFSSQSTWTVEIRGSGIWPGNRTLLATVLHRLPLITSLSWILGEPIPLETVQFLEKNHPLCRLYYELDFGYWRPEVLATSRRRATQRRRTKQLSSEDDKSLAAEEQIRVIERESILNSTNLHSLKVSVSNGGREREPDKMDLILRILTTCPNIKELDISVSRRRGCVVYDTDDLYAFDFTTSNATLAPLESLTVDGYLFHANPNGLKWKEWEADHPERDILYAPWKYLPESIINHVGYPKIKEWGGLQSSHVKLDTSSLKLDTRTNLDIWLQRMDWSHLHTLKIKDATTKDLEKVGGNTLPSLRNVQFSGYYAHHHAILDFIGNNSFTLESIQFDGINFCSLSQVVSTIVEHHRSSLHTLVIKHLQPRRSNYVSPRKNAYRFPGTSFLNVTHLTHLRESIPGLTTLDLDILVSEEWNHELLGILVSFSELEYLTLRFEAQAGGWDDEGEDGRQHGEERSYKEIDNKLYLMMGLKEYLAKRKVGKQFKRLETWVGSEIVGDAEKYPDLHFN